MMSSILKREAIALLALFAVFAVIVGVTVWADEPGNFTLINADTNQPITGFDPIPNGAEVNLAALPTRNLNIRANFSSSGIGSVRFDYDGTINFITENVFPYAFAGDTNADYYPWTPVVGEHVISATPFSGSNRTGSAGESMTLAISVIDENPTSPPAPAPTPTPPPPAPAPGSSSPDLIGHWRFDEASGSAALDSSAEGNNGTLVNGPSRTTGRIGGALSFDGSNDFVTMGDIADIGSNESFTAAFWFKTSDNAGSQAWPGFISKENAAISPRNGWACNLSTTEAGRLSCSVFVNGSQDYVSSGIAINNNAWHHAALVRDTSARTLDLYIDGVRRSHRSSASTGNLASAAELLIGARGPNTAGSLRVKAVIDDVRIYGRALTASEIQDLAEGESEPTPPPAPTPTPPPAPTPTPPPPAPSPTPTPPPPAPAPVPPPQSGMVFPGTSWLSATPESQGIDSDKLEDAIDYLRAHSGPDGVRELVIERNGRIIWKGDNIDRVHGIWSMTKSFTSSVLGILIDNGETNINALAKNYLPSLSSQYPSVTLRHFATMTSGYQASGDAALGNHGQSSKWYTPTTPLFAPGTRFAYWDSAMNQLANVLTRIAGEPIENVFRREVANPIGMSGSKWSWGDFGTIDGMVINGGSGNSGMVNISARELLRFGHLFLNRGNWNGVQVLSSAWVDAATKPQVSASLALGKCSASPYDGRGVYGYNWWTNGFLSTTLYDADCDTYSAAAARKWPDAPAGTYSGTGYNNNDMFVIPEWDMVIVRLGLDETQFKITDAMYNEFLRRVGESFVD